MNKNSNKPIKISIIVISFLIFFSCFSCAVFTFKMQIDFDVLRRASITEVCNYIRMKSNPIMIIKQDSTKKRNAPFDLKRKLGSLPIDTPSP